MPNTTLDPRVLERELLEEIDPPEERTGARIGLTFHVEPSPAPSAMVWVTVRDRDGWQLRMSVTPGETRVRRAGQNYSTYDAGPVEQVQEHIRGWLRDPTYQSNRWLQSKYEPPSLVVGRWLGRLNESDCDAPQGAVSFALDESLNNLLSEDDLADALSVGGLR